MADRAERPGPADAPPRSLLVALPHIGKLSPFMALFYCGAEETSGALAPAYATVAQACGARFLLCRQVSATAFIRTNTGTVNSVKPSRRS